MTLKVVSFEKRVVLNGTVQVPGDKSISHRAVMLGSIAKGTTKITGFLAGEDCLSTIAIFQQLGVEIERFGEEVIVHSQGINHWTSPTTQLDAGNSGTTARLLLGILAGSTITATLTGDASLSKRPMRRVLTPLEKMGATIVGDKDGEYLPLTVRGSLLQAIHYEMPIASAQVKSAILFAALRAKGETVVVEQTTSRDHTERMLRQFGVSVEQNEGEIRLQGGQALTAVDVVVPGDISSAAFFMAAASMVPGSSIILQDVGLNPTRTGIIDVLQQMGAHIEILSTCNEHEEPYGTIRVTADSLRGVEISGNIVPRLIDELPIIALVATQANGTTIIKDAEELRVKETDRIAAVTTELKKLGASIEATADGMIIHGPTKLTGGTLSSYGDHRLGMMAAIAALVASEPIQIKDADCIAISYPTFFEHLQRLVIQSNS